MKKSYILFLIALLAIGISCRDESLDPLNFEKVKKGSILALRGTQLDNIYNKGKAGAEVFPKIATGTEKFVFDGEFLAEDPSTLASVDVYAIKGSGASTTRELLTNVPFSQFKTDDTYPLPWVTISIDFSFILSKIGLENTFPLSQATINTLLTTYRGGINIECDLNLTDGTKVLAADIVSQGLFGSNQFYPAMRLNYAMTDYCSYVASDWAGTFDATELSELFGAYGPYDATLTQDGADPNKFSTDNWYDSGIPVYFIFSPSVDPSTQIVTVPSQPNPLNPARTIVGSGTYNSCLKEAQITMTYSQGTTVLDQLVWKLVKQ
ncbi:MAG: hypothetical protein ABL895_14105 [Cyclobacteriaceae bacterium]